MRQVCRRDVARDVRCEMGLGQLTIVTFGGGGRSWTKLHADLEIHPHPFPGTGADEQAPPPTGAHRASKP